MEQQAEFSNEQAALIADETKGILKHFQGTVLYKRLNRETKKSLDFIVTFFTAQMYAVHLQLPQDWTDEAMDDVLTDVFVRKLFDRHLVMGSSFYAVVKPALGAYFDFLHSQGVFNDTRWTLLKDALPTSATEMRFTVEQKRKHITEDEFFDGENDDDDDYGNNKKDSPEDVNLFDRSDDDCDDESFDEIDSDASILVGQLRGELNRLVNKPGTRNQRHSLGKRRPIPEHRQNPSAAQWAQLFDWADQIYALEPWHTLNTGEYCVIQLPREAEPCFFTIYGYSDSPAVAIYRGYRSMDTSVSLSDSDLDIPRQFSLGFQDAYCCYYTPKMHLEPEDLKPLSELGVWRKGSSWPSFRRLHPGVYPWFIDTDDAEFLYQVLPQVFALCLELGNRSIRPCFDRGETALRSVNPNTREWETTLEKFPEIDPDYEIVPMNNIFVLRQIQREPWVDMAVEIDFVYFPIPLNTGKDTPPVMPRFGLVVDADEGSIMNQALGDADDQDDDAHFMMGLLESFVRDYGRPHTVYCRNERTASFLTDICEKLHIDLYVDADVGIPMVDDILEGMINALQGD